MNRDQALASLAQFLTDPSAKQELTREVIERGGLRSFIKMGWHVLEPGIDLVWGWHLDAICEHLEAVTNGEIRRLLINVPPGTMKPVWEESLVLRDDGHRVPLRDIKIDDHILTHKGRYRRVEAVHVQGDLPCLKITTFSGRVVYPALDHPMLTPAGWVQAQHLRVGTVLGISLPREVEQGDPAGFGVSGIIPDKIVSIEPAGELPCRCLTVEEDHSFTIEDIAVHNSMAVSVFWPCWEWGPRKLPHLRTVAAAYGAHLSQRDNIKCRRLIVSPWYQSLWGDHVQLTGDQNAKTKFENTATGFRMSTSVGGVGTGERGDRFIIDDPHNVKDANSDLKRAEALLWFRETVPTRVNDLRKSAFVVIMQRVHEADISGEILSKELGYEHLMLPMRFEPERKCMIEVTGFQDPRSEDGELLWPEKFPEAEVARLEKDLGSYAVAGQLQQRPAPREGAMFKRSWFPVVKAAPAQGARARRWDLAGTESADADYSVGVKICRGDDGIYYIEHMERLQGTPLQVERAVKAIASQDGYTVHIGIPQDPGQAGKPIWEEELILMGDGSRKRLADVRVGDQVIGKDGSPHRVSAVHEQGVLSCLRLKTSEGREIIAAPDHPFLTPDGWTEAGDLIVGDTLGLCVRPATTGESDRTLEEFRLAGYFIGDGSVGRAAKVTKTGSCDAGFTCHNDYQAEDFARCVKSLGGEVVNRPRYGQYGTRGLQGWLRETGIAGYTSYDKRVPEWVFTSSPEQIAHFIGAFFACDGTIEKDGGGVLFYSVSKGLLQDIQHLLLRLGINSTLKRKNGKYLKTRHESWLLRLRQQDDALGRFARRVPVFHSLKMERMTQVIEKARFRRFGEDYLPDRVVEIEPAGDLPCRCLTVEDTHSFLVQDVVVHNSQVAYYVRQLAGYVIKPEREDARLGSKIQRVEGFAAQCEAGNVRLVEGDWNETFLEEVCTFPASKNDDIVDAVGGAFRMVALNQTTGMIDYLRQEKERLEEAEASGEPVSRFAPAHERLMAGHGEAEARKSARHKSNASFIPQF